MIKEGTSIYAEENTFKSPISIGMRYRTKRWGSKLVIDRTTIEEVTTNDVYQLPLQLFQWTSPTTPTKAVARGWPQKGCSSRFTTSYAPFFLKPVYSRELDLRNGPRNQKALGRDSQVCRTLTLRTAMMPPLLTSLMVFLLANVTSAGLLDYPTHANAINEAQSSAHSGFQPYNDDAFWSELGDLVGDEDALQLRGPLQNFPHQHSPQPPISPSEITMEYYPSQLHGSDLSVNLGRQNGLVRGENQVGIEMPETVTNHETGNLVTQSSNKEDEALSHLVESDKAMSETETRGEEFTQKRQYEESHELLDKPGYGKKLKLVPNHRYEERKKSSNQYSLRYEEKNEKVRNVEMATIYQLVGEKNLDTFRTSLYEFVCGLKRKGSEEEAKDFIPLTKQFRHRLLLACKASLLQIDVYARLFNKDVNKGDLMKVQEEAFLFLQFFWRVASTTIEDVTSKYYYTRQNKFVNSCLERAQNVLYNTNCEELRTESASWRGTEAFIHIYWNKDFPVGEKVSIKQNLRLYVAQFNIDTSLFLRVQAFKLQAWHEETGSPLDASQLVQFCRDKYRYSILFYSKTLGQAGLDRFRLSLKPLLKSVWNRYDDRIKLFIETPISDIINRVSYIMKSSFLKLHVYYSLGFGAQIPSEFVDGFNTKALHLLQYFCEFALFGKVDEKNRDAVIEEIFNKDEIFAISRISLSIDAQNEAVGEWISWHATEFLVRRISQKNLTPDQKEQITKRIEYVAEENNVAALFDPRTDEEFEETFSQVEYFLTFHSARALFDRRLIIVPKIFHRAENSFK
ncbi:hypothetical protein O181_001729 [Austropuccinia psidii MF-1]|uniref:Uncharacterized protein n=1 Tax=Austropuccinia psidii MF-1 TaxID=1389203 RepID=A0A9Q3BB32_9BASI|nr:hypothetical protein [Austropuccinia psidii MF-1]